MGDERRQSILDRTTALVAGPFLLGRRALDLVFSPGQAPPEPPPDVRPRLTVTPPEHAIKRRG